MTARIPLAQLDEWAWLANVPHCACTANHNSSVAVSPLTAVVCTWNDRNPSDLLSNPLELADTPYLSLTLARCPFRLWKELFLPSMVNHTLQPAAVGGSPLRSPYAINDLPTKAKEELRELLRVWTCEMLHFHGYQYLSVRSTGRRLGLMAIGPHNHSSIASRFRRPPAWPCIGTTPHPHGESQTDKYLTHVCELS